jgi:CheY-like chemotaxis protein
MTTTESDNPDRILLVDDNLTNLQVLFQALEQEGYELLVAQSGEEALTIAKEALPQLVLLDINMPGIDGYETCRRLKADEETSKSVVIFLSARSDVKDKVAGLEFGAVDYIGKPFQFEEVLARVKKQLSLYHRHEELQAENLSLKVKVGAGFRDLTEDDLLQMTGGGETARVEFKSTLRWNLHIDKADKRMENSCLKTVAGYLNSEGGVLMVGVDDEGVALGLDKDGFSNEDKLLLHWNSLFKGHLGVEFSPFVRALIRDLRGVRILVIECLRAPQPVFFRRDNDECFFVRTGNGTQQLKPSEVLAYLEAH